jgi:hypothetical protein
MSAKPKLRAGLIGTGFMGKTHAFGFVTASKVFDLPFVIELRAVADVTEAAGPTGGCRVRLRPRDVRLEGGHPRSRDRGRRYHRPECSS